MKPSVWIGVCTLFAAQAAFAQQERPQNCAQELTKAQEALLAGIRQDADRYKSKFNLDIFYWSNSRVRVQIVPGSATAPATTVDANQNLIQLNQAVWCTLPRKEKIIRLFNAELQVLNLETPEDFKISETFQTVDEQTAYLCSITFYAMESSYSGEISNPGRPESFEGYGDEAASAWNAAVKKANARYSGSSTTYRPCLKVGSRPSGTSQVYFCAEAPTLVSACVKRN